MRKRGGWGEDLGEERRRINLLSNTKIQELWEGVKHHTHSHTHGGSNVFPLGVSVCVCKREGGGGGQRLLVGCAVRIALIKVAERVVISRLRHVRGFRCL